jgi:hypothetical protein
MKTRISDYTKKKPFQRLDTLHSEEDFWDCKSVIAEPEELIGKSE